MQEKKIKDYTAGTKKPIGTRIIAYFHLLMGFAILIALSTGLIHKLYSMTNSTLSPRSWMEILIPMAFLVVTGFGLLRMDFFLGYIGTNLYAVVLIIQSIANVWLNGFDNFGIHIFGHTYPFILLILLNLKYKQYFVKTGRGQLQNSWKRKELQ